MEMKAVIVGNSIVKLFNQDKKGPIAVHTFPGAQLEILLKEAKTVAKDGQVIFIQSGIPDLHIKGHPEIDLEKLEKYKNMLNRMENVKPECPTYILPIYPPLHTPAKDLETYAQLNLHIRTINGKDTPNTASRIFHRMGADKWRVDPTRVSSDGIHPTGYEAVRMYRRVVDFIKYGDDNYHRGNTRIGHPTHPLPTSKQQNWNVHSTHPPSSSKQQKRVIIKGPEDNFSACKILKTIHNEPIQPKRTESKLRAMSKSDRIEEIMNKKKERLRKLREYVIDEEAAIESECMDDIKKVMEEDGENMALEIHVQEEEYQILDECLGD